MSEKTPLTEAKAGEEIKEEAVLQTEESAETSEEPKEEVKEEKGKKSKKKPRKNKKGKKTLCRKNKTFF